MLLHGRCIQYVLIQLSDSVFEVKRMANSCGHPALGKDKETKFCNVEVHCGADKDCLYTGWSSWNACSATTCFSVLRRMRRLFVSYIVSIF